MLLTLERLKRIAYKNTTMRIAGYDIQPIVLHLPDDIKYVKQSEDMKNRLHEAGIDDAMFVSGIHAEKIWHFGRPSLYS